MTVLCPVKLLQFKSATQEKFHGSIADGYLKIQPIIFVDQVQQLKDKGIIAAK
jgi:hypothetical protein